MDIHSKLSGREKLFPTIAKSRRGAAVESSRSSDKQAEIGQDWRQTRRQDRPGGPEGEEMD